MYEINWYGKGKCTIDPFEVTREGILEGHTGVTIDARRKDGTTFRGSPLNNFKTEKEAVEHVLRMTDENIRYHKAAILERQAEVEKAIAFRNEIMEKYNATVL
jgi:hypothetical protein